MRITGRAAAVVATALMCIVLLITDIQLVALNKDFYHEQHEKLNTAAKMDMSESDLELMMDVLIDYLSGQRADINVQVEVGGARRPAYDERETTHMVDVLALLVGALTVRNALFIAAVALMGISLYATAKGHMGWSVLLKSMLVGVVVGTLAMAALAGAAAIDFDKFWTAFHEQFFSNDLWMLDPSVSLMINMLPGELFFALVMRIAGVYFAVAGIGIVVCGAAIRPIKRREEHALV